MKIRHATIVRIGMVLIVPYILQYNPDKAIVFTRGFWDKIKIENTEILFVPVWYAG